MGDEADRSDEEVGGASGHRSDDCGEPDEKQHHDNAELGHVLSALWSQS